MRLGCSGCLLVVLLSVGVTAGTAWLGRAVVARPDIPDPTWTASNAASAQQKLAQIARPRPSGPREVVISEAEVNALLNRHLGELAGLPLAGVSVQLLGENRVQLAARVPVLALAAETPLAAILDAVPGGWGRQAVWLRLGGRLAVEERLPPGTRRDIRFEVDGFAIGRVPLPGFVHRLVLSPRALGLLQSPTPAGLQSIQVESGRLVIQLRG